METDEQYFDRLAKDTGREATPGFREFVLDMMQMLDARPRDSDICQMHFAYQAGMAYQREHENEHP